MKRRFFSFLLVCALTVSLIPMRARASGTMGKAGTSQTIAAGGRHSLAIKNDDTLWAWGANNSGQLGDGTATDRHTPVKVMDNVAVVSAGDNHTLAIKTDGTLWAWGANDAGQLGDGTTESRYTPVKIMENVTAVSAGWSHTLAIKTDGTLWAWGNNHCGQLGIGTTENCNTPAKVMDNVIAISVGLYHSLALKSNYELWGWGDNSAGEIGSDANQQYLVPTKIMEDVINMNGGANSTFIIKSDYSLWGCGHNWSGNLGLPRRYDHTSGGALIDKPYRVPQKIVDGIYEVSSSTSVTEFNHTLWIKQDKTLWSCGNNRSGQLGNGNEGGDKYHLGWGASTPYCVLDNVVSMSTGNLLSMALQADGSLWTWGYNYFGQLGDGTTEDRSTPVKIMDSVKLPSGTSGVTQTTLVEKHYPGTVQTVPSTWAEAEVSAARDNGLVPAELEGNYTGNITRLEFCRVGAKLVAAMGKTNSIAPILGPEYEPTFNDTNDPDVLLMSRANVVNGYGDGRFGPNDPITREQAAVMLARLTRALKSGVDRGAGVTFGDAASIASWAKEDVTFLSRCVTPSGKAVMGDTGGGSFSPKSSYTREQAFITFQRLYEVLNAPDPEPTHSGSGASHTWIEPENDPEQGEKIMAQRAVELVQTLSRLIKAEEKAPFGDKNEELGKLKKSIVAQGMKKDEIPDEVYQAFATAVYDALEASNIDELESDPAKLPEQIYDQIKGGLQQDKQSIKVGNTQYEVSYQIMAQKFMNIGVEASFATVKWHDSSGDHTVRLSSTGNHEDMKKALAAYCTALAKLNTEVWKDFLAEYFGDAFGLMKFDIKKDDVKTALDTAEKVINALNNRNKAKELVEECFRDHNRALRDQLLDQWFENPWANGFADYIEQAVPDGKVIRDAAKSYQKVPYALEKWREAKEEGENDEVLNWHYQNFNAVLSELDNFLSWIE